MATVWSITRTHTNRERMAAAMTAPPAAQFCFQVNEAGVIGPPTREMGMIEHSPVPADRARCFDDMPPSQIL
jgi:hypothetical protein